MRLPSRAKSDHPYASLPNGIGIHHELPTKRSFCSISTESRQQIRYPEFFCTGGVPGKLSAEGINVANGSSIGRYAVQTVGNIVFVRKCRTDRPFPVQSDPTAEDVTSGKANHSNIVFVNAVFIFRT